MNRLTFTLLATAATLAAAPARAETRFSIGFHVGVPVYLPPPPVVIAPPPPIVPPPPAVVVHAPAPGYWREVVVRTWVPERWIVVPDHWGRPLRRLEPGHYAYRTDRVWVETRPTCIPGHRVPGYAFNHHRR